MTSEKPLTIDRRRLLAGTGLLATLPLWGRQARAAAPHAFRLGDAEITVLSDGELVLPREILAPDAPPAAVDDALARLGWTHGRLELALNIPLIRIGQELVLVDNGSGGKFQPTAGRLQESLAAAGVKPAEVTRVVITHAHPDHAWGVLNADGTPAFPNATYAIGAAEWDFWMAPELASQAPAEMQPFVIGAQRELGAVRDRITLLQDGQELLPGLSAVATPGHTPGHISLLLDRGDGLIVTGDVATNAIVSFEHPDWRFGFDALPEVATRSRRRMLDRAASDHTLLLGYHWAYPGLGRVERREGAYRLLAES